MKIAYVITRCDDLGGAQIHVRDLAKALKQRGQTPVVLGGSPGVLSEQLEASGIRFIEIKALKRSILPLKDLAALRELRTHLKVLRPDLISAHSSKAGILARMAAASLGIPNIFTAHGWAFSDGVAPLKRRLYVEVERRTASMADRIITVSDYDRAIALDHRVGGSEKVATVHNGMPEIEQSQAADPSQEPPTFLTIARHDRQKDYATLLDAVSRVVSRHPEWKLICIGAGPRFAEATARVKELGLGSSISILGFRTDTVRLLSQAQAYVLVSNWEGLPRSILEAMRAGLPVIGSDVGGVRETLIDGESGYLVPRGDAHLLEARMETLGNDPELRLRMGAAGRRRFMEEFRFERMFEETWGIYQTILKGGSDAMA